MTDSSPHIRAALDALTTAERALAAARVALGEAPSSTSGGGAAHVDKTPRQDFSPAPAQERSDGSKVIEGIFDGKHFLAPDGRRFEVNHNYISKSKLVEGDALKLTITPDGRFIYKQLPAKVPRQHTTGTLSFADGNYQVLVEGKMYQVITSAVTYYKAKPGDRLAVILPADRVAKWATVDNLVTNNFGESNGAGTSAKRDAQDPLAAPAPLAEDGAAAAVSDSAAGASAAPSESSQSASLAEADPVQKTPSAEAPESSPLSAPTPSAEPESDFAETSSAASAVTSTTSPEAPAEQDLASEAPEPRSSPTSSASSSPPAVSQDSSAKNTSSGASLDEHDSILDDLLGDLGESSPAPQDTSPAQNPASPAASEPSPPAPTPPPAAGGTLEPGQEVKL